MENATEEYNFTSAPVENTTTELIEKKSEFPCKNYDLIMNVTVKIILLMLGCVGNSLSVAVMWKERKTSATAFLLIMLAVADTMLLFVWLFLVTFPGMYCFHFFSPFR